MRQLSLIAVVLLLLTPPLGAQDQFLPAMHAQLDAIERQVSQLRQLEGLANAPMRFPSPADLETYLRRRFARDFPPQKLATDLVFYRALELAPAGIDLERLYFAFIRDWIGGYYDIERDIMNIVAYDGVLRHELLPIPYQVTYAHEYVHALQDQHFDLRRIIDRAEASDNRDLRLAVQALIEGDANYVMGKFFHGLLERDSGQVERAYAALPASNFDPAMPGVIIAATQFPYRQGHFFVSELVRALGWDGVDRALRERPPQTTEQIYHPERYLAGEGAIPVEMPDLTAIVGGGWRLRYDGPVGEFYLRQHLNAVLDEGRVDMMASGWGGDRMRIYSNDADDHLTWVIAQVWDTAEDASEFYNHYRYALRLRFPSRSADGVCWIGGAAYCIKRISARETRISSAPQSETALALLSADG